MNLPSDPIVSVYRPKAVLRVTGEDALAFLQGQFTQELRHPSGSLSAYGLWLNQKGKVLADSYALQDRGNWWLVSLTSPATLIRERLEAYIIADDVLLEDVTELWGGAMIAGPTAAYWLTARGATAPPVGQWTPFEEGLIFPGRRGFDASWEWLSPVAAGFPNHKIVEGIPICNDVAIEWKRIQAGIPAVPQDIGPGDLPNEGGLDSVAISYTKGCYLGQEVMARLKSMGQVRRQLLRVQGRGPVPLCPSSLYAEAKKVGEIRSAVAGDEDNTFVGLAMISLLGIGSTTSLSLESNGVPTVELRRSPS